MKKADETFADDRHFLTRTLLWVEKKCPWVHIPLFVGAVAASIALSAKTLETADAVINSIVLSACVLGCVFYLQYILRLGSAMVNAFKPVQTVDVRIVGSRCDTIPWGRRRDVEFYYCAFKPLDGSPYIELRIQSELEYVRLSHGAVGTLRYRGRQYLSFEQRPLTTAPMEGERP